MDLSFHNSFLDILTYVGDHVNKNILIRCVSILILNKRPAIRICIKVANLRKLCGYDTNLESWLNDPNNIYCGRPGRIFITENGEKKYFSYKGSKWANPYTLKQYHIDECLDLYKKYIMEKNCKRF